MVDGARADPPARRRRAGRASCVADLVARTADASPAVRLVGRRGRDRHDRRHGSTIDVDPTVFDVINNVGSNLYRYGFGGDRGFLERDDGQYEEPADVFAWCGGAVLLRRAYLDDVGMFDEQLFLYYEDTDLSWRGRLRGWRYQYVPSSVIRHRHAQSSGVWSPTFRFYTERNRLLVLAKNAPARLAVRAILGAVKRLVVTFLRQVVLRPFVLRLPVRAEAAHQWRVVRSYVRQAPGDDAGPPIGPSVGGPWLACCRGWSRSDAPTPSPLWSPNSASQPGRTVTKATNGRPERRSRSEGAAGRGVRPVLVDVRGRRAGRRHDRPGARRGGPRRDAARTATARRRAHAGTPRRRPVGLRPPRRASTTTRHRPPAPTSTCSSTAPT